MAWHGFIYLPSVQRSLLQEGFPPASIYSSGWGLWHYCCGKSKYSVFSLQRFDHNLPNSPWGAAVLFEEPQVCGPGQVVSAETGLIFGLLLCSELEEMIGDFRLSCKWSWGSTGWYTSSWYLVGEKNRFVGNSKAVNWWNYARKNSTSPIPHLPNYLNGAVYVTCVCLLPYLYHCVNPATSNCLKKTKGKD